MECHRRAGRIASECREWARTNIKAGVLVREILETVENTIRGHGAEPAFPAQSSRNSVAAHYCSAPGDEMAYEAGDCVKVDIGVHVDGWHGDSAVTFPMTASACWACAAGSSTSTPTFRRPSCWAGVWVGTPVSTRS